MAKKKEYSSNTLNDEMFKRLVLVTTDNIKYFFEDLNTLFIVVKDDKAINQFHPRVRYIKGNSYSSNYINDNKFCITSFNVYTTELDEDYNNLMSDMKVLIKKYMKDKVLYAIIIK